MEIKVIGLGGVGSHLLSPLCRFLDTLILTDRSEKKTLVLIDGDVYEARNAERQEFPDIGNKAEMSSIRVKKSFPGLSVEWKPCYVTDENAFLYINEGDTIFLCVDNHATRKLVSDRCGELKEVILISGGNEFHDGNVQIYVRKKGKDFTPSLTQFHPEIEHPQDQNPGEMSCEELASAGVQQLIFANLAVATHMLSAFWVTRVALQENRPLPYDEQYFDLSTGMVRGCQRKGNKEKN